MEWTQQQQVTSFDDVKLLGLQGLNPCKVSASDIINNSKQFIPIATIWMFAGVAAPDGWLFCDGTAIDRTNYAELFAVIGEIYGIGDGSTTFNLPDFRGRTPIGAGQGENLTLRALGEVMGVETVALSTTELPTHDHTIAHNHYGGTHAHTIGHYHEHPHTHTGPSHTHTMAHTHTGPSHTHTMAHTHTGPSHTHTMAHTHTGPSHTHTMAHTHTGGAHTHTVDGALLASPGAGSGIRQLSHAGVGTNNVSTESGGAVTTSASSAANTGAAGTGNTGASSAADTGAAGTGNTGASSAANTGAAGTGNTGASSAANTGSGGTGNTGQPNDSQTSGSGSPNSGWPTDTYTTGDSSASTSGATGIGTAHNNMPPALGINFIIYTGVSL